MGYFTGVNILVTGANGQLGTCIKDEVDNGNSENIWHFADRSMVDITDIDCRVGDRVEIFGQHLPVTKLSQWLDTIPYEILTSVSERVKRLYFE